MTTFSSEDSLLASAISAAALSADAIAQALDSESNPTESAALAILAGVHGVSASMQRLWDLMDDDSLTARAAAWGLAQLDCESFVCSQLEQAGLDQREQAYHCLAALIARSAHSAELDAFVVGCVGKELERVEAGKTGLGEQACRLLAMLGSSACEEAIKRVTNEDKYSDRYELQRLRKAIADGGKDSESLNALSQAWTLIFADDLADESAASAADVETDSEASATNPEVEATPAPTNPAPTAAADPDAAQAEAAQTEGEAGEAPAVEMIPIDWDGFTASPEAAAINKQSQAIVAQMGPMFEQLAVQALGKNFADLSAQEVVVMVLQVLPQAIPQEYMQAALSPLSINGLQALARFLARTGVASLGNEIEEGVRQIRGHIQQQIRASGGLHGSDYDEPSFDEAEQADGETDNA